MSRPAILVFAYSEVGHACLDLLLRRGAEVRAVYTYEDTPGEAIWFPSVAELARARGIDVRIAPGKLSEPDIASMASLAPDLVFSFYYRDLLPPAVLALPALGAYNMHGSLLPRFRGRAPVNWAVLLGESETGATLHLMTPRADDGDIVDQQRVPIGPDDTAFEVQRAVTHAAVAILDRQLEALEAGRAPRRPQDAALATKFGRRGPEDGRIDWSWPARRVHDLVRAVTHPWPGAFGDVAGRRLVLWKTRVDGEQTTLSPGLVHVASGKAAIACGEGHLLTICAAAIGTAGDEPPPHGIHAEGELAGEALAQSLGALAKTQEGVRA